MYILYIQTLFISNDIKGQNPMYKKVYRRLGSGGVMKESLNT